MRRIMLLVTLCLLSTPALAQPFVVDMVEAQARTLARLRTYSFDKDIVAEELGDRGEVVRTYANTWHAVSLDNGTLHAGNNLVSSVNLRRVKLMRLDAVAKFVPAFLWGNYSLPFVREENGVYVFKLVRPSGSPGFQGLLWVDSAGHVLKAQGEDVFADAARGEVPLRYTITMNRQFFPAYVEIDQVLKLWDKNGKPFEAHVRVRHRFYNYKRFQTEEPKVIEEGEPGEVGASANNP